MPRKARGALYAGKGIAHGSKISNDYEKKWVPGRCNALVCQ